MSTRRTTEERGEGRRAAPDPADPGFTPGARHFDELFARLGGDDADDAIAALVRAGAAAARASARRYAGAPPRARARMVELVGKVVAQGGDDEARRFLLARLVDTDPVARRRAAVALGKLRDVPEVSAALLDALAAALDQTERDAPLVAALADAVGKTGDASALPLLRRAAELGGELRATRAVHRVERTHLRETAARFVDERTPREPVAVVLRCRAGLEAIVADEAQHRWSPRVLGPGRVAITLAEPPAVLAQVRTMLDFAFPLPAGETGSASRPSGETGASALADDDVSTALATALTSDAAVELLRRFTEGPVRYRIAWADGRKRRAATFAAARAVARARPELIDDPSERTWEVEVGIAAGKLRVELVPHWNDDRFAYRRRDVPAASHPTIAAALVRVAGVRADDVVWDPFVGSGLELCERALAGPHERLVGTDIDPKALLAARANLDAAGVRATLLRGDATTFVPIPTPTLVVTNPPMGRRVHRTKDLEGTLDRFVAHVARVLSRGGRFVWLSPHGARTRETGRRAGLVLRHHHDVDLGGFSAELQLFNRP